MVNRSIYIKQAEEVLIESQSLIKERVNHYYSSSDLLELKSLKVLSNRDFHTTIEFKKEDVVKTINDLCLNENVFVLNFASARYPGGGFLKGAIAQEEAIARASDMYLYLKNVDCFYNNPKHYKNGFYDSDIILSKDVNLLRDSCGEKLEDNCVFHLITSCAVNVSSLKSKNMFDSSKVVKEMTERIENIFEVALINNAKILILGAFGCGVFGNNPYKVKQIFENVLNCERYKNKFEKIIFSVYDEYMFNKFKF